MADPAVRRAHALPKPSPAQKRPSSSVNDERPDKYKELYRVLSRKCSEVESANLRLARRIYKTGKVLEHVKRERSILMEKLDQYEDGYRDAAKTIQANALASITSIAGGHSALSPEAESILGFPAVRLGPGRPPVSEGFPMSGTGMLDEHGRWIGRGMPQDPLTPQQGTPGPGKKVSKKSPGLAASPHIVHSCSKGGPSSAGQSKPKPDPHAPKKPSNAFFMYSQIQRAAIQEEYHASAITGHHELTKLIAKKWNELPAEEKRVYYVMYEKDKERYATELQVYQQTGSVPSSARKQLKGPGTPNSQASSVSTATPAAVGDSDVFKDSPASMVDDDGSMAPLLPGTPPLIREPCDDHGEPSQLPASLFDDDLSSSGALGDIVDSNSPLMECPAPDVMADVGVSAAFSAHHHHPLDLQNDMDAQRGTGGSLAIDSNLNLQDREDLCDVFSMGDDGSSAGLDPQEAAMMARSFVNPENEEGDSEDVLDMNFGHDML